MRLISFLGGLLIITLNCFSQTDFRPGYIITHSYDTIFGEIDYRTNSIMGQKCRFKDDKNIIKEFTPNDLIAYRFIDSKYFISKEIDSINVFLEYLVKGEANLYFYRDEIGNHFYVEKENIPLRELKYSNKEIKENGKYYMSQSDYHKYYLMYLMSDAPEIKSEIMDIDKPEHKSLTNLAVKYNNLVCPDEKCEVYRKEIPWFNVSVEPFLSNYSYYFQDFNPRTIEPGINVYLKALITNENIYFKTGLSLIKTLPFEDLELTKIKGVKVPVQFQYLYSAYRVQPKLGLGMNIFIINTEVEETGYTIKGQYAILAFNTGLNFKLSDKTAISLTLNDDLYNLYSIFLKEFSDPDIRNIYSLQLGLIIEL